MPRIFPPSPLSYTQWTPPNNLISLNPLFFLISPRCYLSFSSLVFLFFFPFLEGKKKLVVQGWECSSCSWGLLIIKLDFGGGRSVSFWRSYTQIEALDKPYSFQSSVFTEGNHFENSKYCVLRFFLTFWIKYGLFVNLNCWVRLHVFTASFRDTNRWVWFCFGETRVWAWL